MKLVGGSAGISIFIDLIIGLVHGLFNKEKINKDLYEVRTRKILLISNSIASTSNIIQTMITKNPKNLDIGGDCLKTQTSSVKIDTKLVKMALNMDLKDKKMTKKIVFRQSGGDYWLPFLIYSWI